jgi:hypothetical protein
MTIQAFIRAYREKYKRISGRWHYEDCVHYRNQPCQAWLIELPDGRKFLQLYSVDCPVEHIHHHVAIRHQEFKLSPIDTGEFWIEKIDHAYSGDSRKLDETFHMAPL